MYRDYQLEDGMTKAEARVKSKIWAQLIKDVDFTMDRAGALMEKALREGEDIETEYDYFPHYEPSVQSDGSTIVSSYTEGGSPHTTLHMAVNTIKCGWTKRGGFYGISYLKSSVIPYDLESVYRVVREHAYRSALSDAKADALKEISAKYQGKILYTREGSRFARLG